MSAPAAPPPPAAPGDAAPDPRPLVISVCGTFLKKEMRSIYRQVTGLQRVRTIVYTQTVENASQFPVPALTRMTKLHHRTKGNFLLRFWYKYVVRQWPPPIQINKYVGPCHPYDMPDLLRADQPALAHIYYGHKAVRFLGMLRDWGGPWIVSFHGVDAAKFLDQPGYLESLQEVFAEAELVLARSRSLLDRLQRLGCPAEKLRLNPTPIPMAHLPAISRSAPADGAWRLVQACRLIPKKGILTTLTAFSQVLKTFPNARYILCGTGPQEDELRQHAADLGIADHVEFLGWVSGDKLLSQLNAAHIFLHPSELTEDEDQEGIPNSMLEAMATGLPIVATLHGGIPEAVTDGVSGLLVAEKSPADLASALLRVMADPALWQQLSQGAATEVRQQFEAERQVAHLEDLYFEAISRAAARQSAAVS
ncbi:MAG: glycosyltransferase [Verrucomicrobiales bacterium]|nr:glycosyltransferase [Verrucomicrobiales bacterium]